MPLEGTGFPFKISCLMSWLVKKSLFLHPADELKLIAVCFDQLWNVQQKLLSHPVDHLAATTYSSKH